MNLFLLASTSTPKENVPHLINNDKRTAFCPAAAGINRTLHSQPQAIAAEFYNQAAWHAYQEGSYPPGNKLSEQEMDDIFYGGRICISADAGLLPIKKVTPKQNTLNGASSMLNFTQSQLEELSQYSQEALKRATQRLQEVTKKGIAPTDPFKWFSAICRSYRPNEEAASPFSKKAAQQPHTNAGPYTRPTVGPKAIYKSEQRTLETDFEWCSKVEPRLHEFVLSDHPGLRYSKTRLPTCTICTLNP